MKNISVCIVFFIAFFTCQLQAQQSGQLTIRFYPGNTVVRFDTVLVATSGSVIKTSAGIHRLRMWASGHEFLDTTLTILSDSNLIFSRKLSPTPGFLEYQAASKRYYKLRFTRNMGLGGSATSLCILGITQLGFFAPAETRKVEAGRQLQKDWALSLDANEQSQIATEMEALKSNYTRFSILRWGTGAVLLGTSAWLFVKGWKALKKASETEKPVFEEEKLLSRIEILPQFSNLQSAGLGFIFRF